MFDAIVRRRHLTESHQLPCLVTLPEPAAAPAHQRPWNAYANNPLQAKFARLLVPELRAYLKQQLPEYMVPAAFVLLEALPLTPNGKVNRKALPAPDKLRPELKSDFVAPRTPAEEALATVWRQMLGVQQVGVHDSFFDLGGHSLLATQLLFHIRDAMQVELPLRLLFETPTIAGMAQAIEDAQAGGGHAPLAPFVIDLKTEAALDPTIQITGAQPASPTSAMQRVLLTGATGFLGAFLLDALLRQTQAEVYCLVRATGEQEAMQRIETNLRASMVWDAQFSHRIIPLPGDLAQPQFGLTVEQFTALGDIIDCVYHNGALVNFIYPYSELKAPNVRGTQEVLRLASMGRVKPVHFVSTLYVFAPGDAQDGRPLREDDLPRHGNDLAMGYTQSKWVAEHMLLEARARGLPIAIYRPGRIGGHSQTGACQTNDFFWRMVQASLEVGSVPDIAMQIDIAPVDYVSQAIVHLSQQATAWGRNFHLFNPHTIDLRAFAQLLRQAGYAVETVAPEQWQMQLLKLAERDPNSAAYPLLPLLAGGALNAEAADIQFDGHNTQQGLTDSTITCPPLNARLLNVYLAFFRERGFLRQPLIASPAGVAQ